MDIVNSFIFGSYRLTREEFKCALACHIQFMEKRRRITISFAPPGAVDRLFTSRPDKDKDVEFSVNGLSINVSIRDLSESTISWYGITKGGRSQGGFLLYLDDQAFLWFPLHAFNLEKDVEIFDRLARSKIHDYIDIPP